MDSWHSYSSIYAVGHRAIQQLLAGPVNVEEKIDGSQFSFGVSDDGEVKVRSKGAVMIADAPEKMFQRAVDTVKELAPILHPGWTYRAEYLAKPKHNTLAYERTPNKHLIVFDINDGHESYLDFPHKEAECSRLGLECIPLIHTGMVDSMEIFRTFLEYTSVLGGQKVEGVVVKPRDYNLWGADKKVMMGKFVSEAFKESHAGAWKVANPGAKDIVEVLALSYGVQARWTKALQHLKESGSLEGSPRDIGALMKEIPADIEKECREEILNALWEWAWPKIRRGVTRGVPEWYKELLLKQAFESEQP